MDTFIILLLKLFQIWSGQTLQVGFPFPGSTSWSLYCVCFRIVLALPKSCRDTLEGSVCPPPIPLLITSHMTGTFVTTQEPAGTSLLTNLQT